MGTTNCLLGSRERTNLSPIRKLDLGTGLALDHVSRGVFAFQSCPHMLMDIDRLG